MERVHIKTDREYDVLIGPGLLARVGEITGQAVRPCKAAIITDDTVRILYGEAVADSLEKAGFETDIWAFPHGEKNKSMNTLAHALEWLGSVGLSRSDLVVALGGGVPGDLAGFAAVSTIGAPGSFKFRRPYWRRWIPPWAAKRRWTCGPERTWPGPFTSRNWCCAIPM